jgi:hypothetical protein
VLASATPAQEAQVSAKLLTTCIGKAGAASQVLFGVRAHTNQLQRALTRILDGTMQWLIKTALKGLNGMMMIHGKRVDYVTTDFSGVGLGGVLQPTPLRKK